MKVKNRPRDKSGKFVLEHGLTQTSFHRRYWGMVQRCTKPYSTSYKNYGARGIQCFWNTFQDFKNDMYDSYVSHVSLHGEKDTFLDRINNDGHYQKHNCRWVTRKQQNRNTRTSVSLTAQGKTKLLCEWAEELDIPTSLIWTRIHRDGRSVEEALFTPRERNKK